jgi:hypothetical protein
VSRRALIGLAGALVLAGCGSKPLSTTELASQATRLCTIASTQTALIPTPASPAGTAAYLQRGIAVMTPELERLRALRPSSDVADVYATSIGSFAKKLSYLKDTMRDLAGGEDPVIAIKTLQQELGPIESQENAAWQALEIPACLNS